MAGPTQRFKPGIDIGGTFSVCASVSVRSQLAGEMLKAAAGTDVLCVACKGSAGVVQGLLSNDAKFIIDGVTTIVPHVPSGKLRALANRGSRPIAALAEVRERRLDAWLDPASSSAAEFRRFTGTESGRRGDLIQRTGIRLD